MTNLKKKLKKITLVFGTFYRHFRKITEEFVRNFGKKFLLIKKILENLPKHLEKVL